MKKNGIFLLQNVFISEFLTQNQLLRIDPCVKFQLNCTKDKGTRIFTWNNIKNALMTSYLPRSDDISNIFRILLEILFQTTIMPSLVVIEPQTKEKQRGHTVPPPPSTLMVPKDPSLNRVNPIPLFCPLSDYLLYNFR